MKLRGRSLPAGTASGMIILFLAVPGYLQSFCLANAVPVQKDHSEVADIVGRLAKYCPTTPSLADGFLQKRPIDPAEVYLGLQIRPDGRATVKQHDREYEIQLSETPDESGLPDALRLNGNLTFEFLYRSESESETDTDLASAEAVPPMGLGNDEADDDESTVGPEDIALQLNPDLGFPLQNVTDETMARYFPSMLNDSAAPETDVSRLRSWKVSFSEKVYNKIVLMSQYSAAAYCPQNYDDLVVLGRSKGKKGRAREKLPPSGWLKRETPIRCPVGNCPLVEEAGAVATLRFTRVGYYDTSGFVALDHTNKMIVLSIRGAASRKNWNGVFFFQLRRWPELLRFRCPYCSFHTGMLTMWQQVMRETEAAEELIRLTQLYPKYPIVFTGHSLGGAVATIASLYSRLNVNPNSELYSFGAPRVGSRQLSLYLSPTDNNYRVVHAADVVPMLPPAMLGYEHIQPEFILRKGGSRMQDLKAFGKWAASYTLCRVSIFKASRQDHGWYFGPIGACRDTSLR